MSITEQVQLVFLGREGDGVSDVKLRDRRMSLIRNYVTIYKWRPCWGHVVHRAIGEINFSICSPLRT